MPTYTFYDKNKKKEFDISMSMSELDDYKAQNSHLTQVLKPIPLADPTRLGIKKPDSGFRDVLKKAKNAHRGSNINTW
jgi:hypothetical protein